MHLLIVRHAIAVPHGTPEVPEDERPLTPRGEKRFRAAARGLARICRPPDVLLSSPLVRARQTADIAPEAWGDVKVSEADALAGGSGIRRTRLAWRPRSSPVGSTASSARWIPSCRRGGSWNRSSRTLSRPCAPTCA